MDETDSVGWPSLSRRALLQSAPLGTLLGLSLDTGAAGTDTDQQFVVRTRPVASDAVSPAGSDPETRKAAAEAALRPLRSFAAGRHGIDIDRSFWLLDGALVTVDPEKVHPRELQALDTVAWLHENHEFRIPEPRSPTTADHGERTYGLEQIGAPAVWDRFDTQGSGASVAVVDTGVDPTHPDIDIDPANFAAFDEDGTELDDPEVRDTSFHGTHVSGSAVGGDASGRHIGVAPAATLYHAVGLPDGGGTFAQIVAALEWAVENGVDVANLSLGAPGFIAEFVEPVRNTVAAGTVVVAAAGNDGAGVVSTPGAVVESFAVGAADSERAIPEFSGGQVVDTAAAWGRDAPDDWPAEYAVPDVAGPGVDVFSAFPEDADPPPGSEPIDDQWLELSGTSMAAPHVAGTVALLQAASADVPESFDAEQLTRALATTATKPEERAEPDPRYGDGIIDAVAATSRVAAESGVEGQVTDTAGDPVSRGTVSLDWFPVDTETDGSYRIRADAGSYDLEADGFGFASSQQSVEVTSGFTTVDFELSRTLDVALTSGQPDGLEADGDFSVTFRVANVNTYQVEPATEFEGAVSLFVDGDEIAPGETVPVESDATDLTLTVDPAADARGDLSFTHTFTGLDETVERTTGPTGVFETFLEIAVVDRANGVFTEDIAGVLRENLDPIYEVSTMTPDDALAAAGTASVAGFVVQSLGSDEALIESFVQETALPQLGVVYLQQSGGTGDIAEDGLAADAIHKRSQATGDPRDVVDTGLQGANPRVRYEITDESHQIIENAGVEGTVTLYEAFPVQFFGAFHSYFEGFEGEINGRTIADVSAGVRTDPSPGLAVDDLSRTVLAASLGLSEFVGRRVFQSGAVALLASAAEYAATAPRVSVLEDQPARVEPGDPIELRLAVRELLAYELTLGAQSTLTESELTVTLNGTPIEFGEPVTRDDLTGEVTLRIEGPERAGERVALSHRFVTRGRRGGEETTTAETGPTALYTPPLAVPTDVDSINEAVDIVVEGGDIIVGGRGHAEEAEGLPSVGVLIDKPGVTLRPMRGAEPGIYHAADRPNPEIVRVTADGVTIEGIDLNVIDGDVDERNETGTALAIAASTSDVTARNLYVGGTIGVQIAGDTTGVTVDRVTAIETVLGVGTSSSSSGTVEDATIHRVRVIARPETTFRGGIVIDTAASGVTVTDCYVQVTDGEVGIGLVGPLGGGDQCRVSNNRVVADELGEPGFGVSNAGIYVNEIATIVENNRVEGTYTGVQVSDLGFGEEEIVIQDNNLDTTGAGVAQFGDYVTASGNDIDAETGFRLGDDPDESAPTFIPADAVLARDNDLAATALPFAGEPDEGFGAPDGPFDCRRNYLGSRGYDESITDGSVVSDPLLTDSPTAGDETGTPPLGTDVLLDPGRPHGLGIPGPTAQTIWDVLGVDGPDDFLGAVDRWDADRGAFRPVRDEGEIDPLSGFRVTPGAGRRVTVEFRGGEVRDRELDAGEHLVCAPAYGDDSVFDAGTAEIAGTRQGILQPPREQVGPDEGPAPEDGADKSALTAYLVDVESPGTIEPSLDTVNPTMEQVLTALGLDPTIHENPGKPPEDTMSDPPPFTAATRDHSGDAPPVRAVFAVLGRHLRTALAASEAEITATLDRTIEDALAEIESAEAVERAASRLLAQFYGVDVIDSDGEQGTPAEVRRVANEE